MRLLRDYRSALYCFSMYVRGVPAGGPEVSHRHRTNSTAEIAQIKRSTARAVGQSTGIPFAASLGTPVVMTRDS
jgi:hypothetical protein